jgi:hypothetical protein
MITDEGKVRDYFNFIRAIIMLICTIRVRFNNVKRQ